MISSSHDSKQKLSGLRALVTGAGVRIGQAIALALAQEGCDVIVHYSSSSLGAQETVRKIRGYGRNAVAVQADFLNFAEVRMLADRVLDEFGSLDILINNASSFPAQNVMEADNDLLSETLDSWEHALNVNARAPFFLTQYLVPALKQSRFGNVVNILDTSVSRPFVSRAAHSVSKATLASFTELAAKTLYPEVRVNAVQFGAILPADGLSDEDKTKRSWSGVEDAVNGVMFVLKTEFVRGEIVRVDGGVGVGIG